MLMFGSLRKLEMYTMAKFEAEINGSSVMIDNLDELRVPIKFGMNK